MTIRFSEVTVIVLEGGRGGGQFRKNLLWGLWSDSYATDYFMIIIGLLFAES